MKLLHTSDWHVGKTLKGRHRLDEQREVLNEIVELAIAHEVDAIMIAGDVYENVSPTADAQQLVVRTLLRLARAGIEVIAIAGNHDHGPTFEAYRPLMGQVGIRMIGNARPADKGGAHTFVARSTGEQAVVATLPFLSSRYAIRAAQVITNTPAENVGAYDQHVGVQRFHGQDVSSVELDAGGLDDLGPLGGFGSDVGAEGRRRPG